MTRAQATSTIQLETDRVKVTEWHFSPGAETGWHRHSMDYVVVPMTSGSLLLETPRGPVHSALDAGGSYSRLAGVEHNVINDNDYPFSFIEIELKCE